MKPKVVCRISSSMDAKRTLLLIDFVRETCISFGAELYLRCQITPEIEKGLRHRPGISGINVDGKLIDGELIFLKPKSESIERPDITNVALPENPVFVIDADDNTSVHLMKVRGDQGCCDDRVVTINTPSQYPLWSAVAAGIALHEFSSRHGAK